MVNLTEVMAEHGYGREAIKAIWKAQCAMCLLLNTKALTVGVKSL